jgi:ectoine hydroxylase-related dioxygenase (phytanoyl-CoA dioxygenase family)
MATTTSEPRMDIRLTPEQRRDFEEKGYVLLEDFFEPAELDRLLTAIDEVRDQYCAEKGVPLDTPFAVRNALTRHEAFLDLIDHPRMLPLVVDVFGWNIQIRTTHLDYRPPYPKELIPGELGTGKGEDHKAGYRNVVWHPDLAGPYLFEAPSLDGRLPYMEIKVGYYLSDMTQPSSGELWVVPGSHNRKPEELRAMEYRVPLEQAVPLNVRANTALLWRTAVWHCVAPQLSDQVRKVFYVGYNYRWMRPTDYERQDPDLIARSSPIRRQLLGALATGRDPMSGTSDPAWEPASQHWIPRNWEDVPLKAWAEERDRAATAQVKGLHL